MANPFDQFDANEFNQFDKKEAPTKPQPQPFKKTEERGFWGDLSEMITGKDRMTKEMENLPGLGSAPEMNEMSMRAFKAALGTIATGKPEELKKIFKKQYGDDVSFIEDSKGNIIVNFPSGSYPLNRPGFSMQDIPKLVADIAAFTPAGRTKTIGGAATGSALTEAGFEAAEASVGGDFTPSDVVGAGIFGGLFKGVENVAGDIFRAIKGTPEEGAEALVKESAEAGIPLKTSDVMPPQTFAGKAAQETGEKIPFAGTGSVRETQQEFRSKAVEQYKDQFGDFSYNAIIKSLRDKKNKVLNSAGNVLESTGNKLDEAGEVALLSTQKSIDDAIEELTKPGVIESSKALGDLNQLMNALKTPQTYTSMKENRTAFREIVESLDPSARSQLTSRGKALLRGVEGGMTADMKSFAKANLSPQEFNKLQKANAVYAREATKLKNSRLKGILDKGDFTPESVGQMLFSQKPSEIKALYGSLTTEGRNNARAAIINKVVDNVSKRQAGFSPNSFATELKKFDPQIKTFFKGRDRRALEGLRRGLEASRRAQDASVTTPTGQSLIGGLTAYSAFTDLGLTLGLGGTAGGLARLYESPPVRNALIRLAGTPKGSTAFEKALARANEALISSSQALRSAQQDKE